MVTLNPHKTTKLGLIVLSEKWFKKLKKVLSEMPNNVEISVCAYGNNASTVRMHERGAVKDLEAEHDDRMFADFGQIEINSFDADNVIANSERF